MAQAYDICVRHLSGHGPPGAAAAALMGVASFGRVQPVCRRGAAAGGAAVARLSLKPRPRILCENSVPEP